MPDWKALRAEFPLLDRYVYFNACSLGPLPRRGRAALAQYAEDWDSKGTPVWYSDWLPLLARFREKVGDLLTAPAGSTAIAPSVSVALTTLATGLPLPKGRNKVLIGELDFPTIGHQWLSRPEFEVEFVPSRDGMTIPPEAFAERIDDRTALVATTHLFYTTWLSGGPGNAFLYVRPELIPQVRPRGTGWFATRDPFSFTLQELVFADDARRLETGTWAMASHYAGLAGLELILEVGVANIQERLRDLTGRILERCDEAGVRTFTPREREKRCGIVTLECDHPEEVEAALHREGVIVDSRPGRVRLSPHWCVTEEELERAMDLVLHHLGAGVG